MKHEASYEISLLEEHELHEGFSLSPTSSTIDEAHFERCHFWDHSRTFSLMDKVFQQSLQISLWLRLMESKHGRLLVSAKTRFYLWEQVIQDWNRNCASVKFWWGLSWNIWAMRLAAAHTGKWRLCSNSVTLPKTTDHDIHQPSHAHQKGHP